MSAPLLANSSESNAGPVIASVNINSCVGSITISVTSGQAPYTYVWEDSGGTILPPTTFVADNLTADNYTVTVTDNNGDFVKATYTVTNPPDLVGTVVVNNVTCRGDLDAQVVVTMSNGNPGYDWTLDNSGGGQVATGSIAFPNNVITIGGLGVDTYTLNVADQDGCTGQIIFTIIEPANFLNTNLVSQTNATCSNSTNGSLEVVGTGGWGGYSYLWIRVSDASTVGTTAAISGLVAGDYTVYVTDANGCIDINTYTITAPAPIATTSSLTQVTCNGLSDGAVDVTVTGGNGGYTYLWSNGATTQDISGVAAGTYTLTITDNLGCTYNENFIITEPAVLTINENIRHVDCFGNNSGRIRSNVSGGTAPYTYAWSTGNTGKNLNNRVAGSYSLTVTDANGCTTFETFTITEPAMALSVQNLVSNLPSCFGGNDGSLAVTMQGGTAPYSYNWSSGSTSSSSGAIASGIYTVTVTDANGCAVVENYTLNDPIKIAVAPTLTLPTCNGGNDGSITVVASNGTAPYTYNWNTGAVGATVNALAAGTYQVTVADAGGCSVVETIVLGEPAVISGNSVVNDISCNGQVDGSIFLAVTGGTGPYTYLWNTGATTGNISALAAGAYSVTITDASGCSKVEVYTVIEPAAIKANFTKMDVLCKGNSTGAIDLTPSGGTAPYSFVWSNGSTSEDISSLSAGSYSVTVKDASNCAVVVNVTIVEPATVLDLTGIVSNVSCNGGTNGSINTTVTGGVAPYSYLWNTGATTQGLTNVAAGNYSIQITDSNGCVKSFGFTVSEPTPLFVGTTVNQVSCNGADDGSITLNVSGGTAPYTYLWNDGATVQNKSALQPANYTVTVTDANGCQNVQNFAITEPLTLTNSFTKQDVLCFGQSTGIINISPAGGTAPYTFVWSNGAVTEDLNNIPAGSYTVTITDANGCALVENVQILQPATALTFTDNLSQITCNGAADGAIALTVVGGTAPYSFNWSNGSTNQNLSGLSPGNYSVTITDANGCLLNSAYTITDPPVLAVTGSSTDVTCFGASNGSIDLTVSGGEAPYTYIWSHGANTEDVSGLAPSNYTVQVVDNRGCSVSESFLINGPTPLNLSYTKVDVDCFGDSSGSIDITVTGGVAPYTYAWSNGAVLEDISSLQANTYTVTVTDANGCQLVQNIDVNQPGAALAIAETVTDISCFGANNGSVQLAVSGGTAPYTYSWSNGGTTKDVFGLIVGNYNVTVTDSKGCMVTGSYTINSATALQLTSSIQNLSCNSAGDGLVDIAVVGGTAPYTYLWSNGAITEDINNIAEGTYQVLVSDANGCTLSRSFTVTQPLPISANTTITDVTCFGVADGSIEVSVTGGVAPYTYLWSNGAVTADLFNISGGTYTLTITDANGCNRVENHTVIEPSSALAVTSTVTDVNCFGSNNGAINITVSGGTAPYSYVWNQGAVSEDISGLGPGSYQVTITDANGCTLSQPFTVTSPAVLQANTLVNNVSCNGLSDGTIDLTMAGGTAPYVFNWSNGATTEDISGLATGTYQVLVSDANGCTLSRAFTVTQPLPISANTTITDVTCFGVSDGSIDVNVTGGVAPYSYLWSTGAVTADLLNISGGTYTLTITDANGCKRVESYTVVEPNSALTVTSTVTDVNCFGSNNGAINITVSGGTAPYSYVWNQGAVSEDISGLGPGSYQVTITDAKGCTLSQPFTVTSPIALQTNTTVSNVSCNGLGDGAIDLTMTGGTAPYTFTWSNGATTEDMSGLIAGTYQVLVVDANGCSQSEVVTVSEPAVLAASYTSVNVSCFGGTDASIDLTVSGGTFPYTFAWSNGATTADISNLTAGNYTVTITDVMGCSTTESITISQPGSVLSASAMISDETCSGLSDGSINLTVIGGVAPYTFAWNSGQTTEDIFGLTPGTYQVTITDNNGCNLLESFEVRGPQPITFSGVGTNLTCYQSNDGSIDMTVSGGTAPYTFSWTNGSTVEDIFGLGIGSYSVTVTDANGCTGTRNFNITQPLPLTITALVTDVTCFGQDNGSIDLTISGGTAPYSYSWSNAETSQDLNNLAGGNYIVTVTDSQGCTASQSIDIVAPTSAIAVSHTMNNVQCFGAASGQVLLDVTGGTAPFNYQWSNGSAQKNLVNVVAGSYEVEITDAKGCAFSANYVISQPDMIDVAFDVLNSTCLGDSDGSVTAEAFGGVAPYTYVWSNGSTSKDQFGLTGGTYNVTITDANNCSITRSVLVGDSRSLIVDVTKTDVLCKGESSAAILLDVTGGSGNYTYLWSSGQKTPEISTLSAGVYTATITDSGGCATTISVTISEPSLPLSADLTKTEHLSCFGESTGFALANVSGGVAPYTFLWSTGERTSSISGLGAGKYSLSITDANGCLIQNSFTITQPNSPVEISIFGNTDLRCYGQSDGSIRLSVAGGTAPYSYLWSTGSTSESIDNLRAGDYTVRVTDATGCVTEKIISVIEPDELRFANVNINQSQCFDDRNGAIELDVEGGTRPYTYQWSTGATTKNIIGITSGTYSLTVTDARGCEIQSSYTLRDPALFKMNPDLLMVTCVGANDGLITLNIEGIIEPVSIRWNTGASSETITNLAPGNYNVIVTNGNGCTIQQDFTIIEPLPLTLDAYVEDAIRCGDPKSGRINMIVSGGSEPYSYHWSNGESTSTLNDILPGTYVVNVTDRNGCRATGTYSVQQPEPLQIGLTTRVVVDCETRAVSSKVLADVVGGTGAYRYEWNIGTSTEKEIELHEPARLTLVVHDGLGCRQTRSIDVRIPELAEADYMYRSESIDRTGELAANEPVRFFDQTIGEAIDWSWDFGDGFDSNEVDPIHTFDSPGTYSVVLTVQDASGCSSVRIQTLEITEGYRVMLPNAFTPNGDGNNDFFRPKMVGLAKAQFMVYNTWGEVIFSSDDMESKGWNGEINGKKAENGNYVFKIIGVSFNGLHVERDGVFALIR